MRKSIVVIIVVMLALSALDIISQGISERKGNLLPCDKSPDEPPVTSGKRILLKQEIVYWQDNPDGQPPYRLAIRDQDGSEYSPAAGAKPYIIDCGDWEGDGKDEVLEIYDYDTDRSTICIRHIYAKQQLKGPVWFDLPYIYLAAFGDVDGDGIGDVPYNFTSKGGDRYPLMQPIVTYEMKSAGRYLEIICG